MSDVAIKLPLIHISTLRTNSHIQGGERGRRKRRSRREGERERERKGGGHTHKHNRNTNTGMFHDKFIAWSKYKVGGHGSTMMKKRYRSTTGGGTQLKKTSFTLCEIELPCNSNVCMCGRHQSSY